MPGSPYPSTRYTGSKRRFLDWIWENTKNLRFDSVLDVFGGTASVSLLYKRNGKHVKYNDLLKFNTVIATALIPNKDTTVTDTELDRILLLRNNPYPDFIEKEFAGIFYTDEENIWLDRVVCNIWDEKDKYKQAILFAALFQACLAKRPFNLFHRANLYIRTNSVSRTFGNKTTWERPFSELMKRYVHEYNRAVWDNGRTNEVLGGYDALKCPGEADLVYLDPPYFSSRRGRGTDYLAFYHFLEGLANYHTWMTKINLANTKTKKISEVMGITDWTHKSKIESNFDELIKRYQGATIVLSYQDNGIPSRAEIEALFKKYKKNVQTYSFPHQYALSSKKQDELLFIAK